MEKFLRWFKKIFFLPPLPTLLLALFGYGFELAVVVFEIDIPVLQYLAYTCSAYALIITITGLPHLAAFAEAVRQYINRHPLMKKLRSTAIGERFLNDIRFRTEISLYQGLLMNSFYIVMELVFGIYYHSVWFIALAFYYILLVAMRFILLRKGKKGKITVETELCRYRSCGIMLLVMNQTLAGIVIFMVHQNKGFDYPGLLIYAMAFFSFYSVIIAVVNLIKFRKHGSPVLSAAKTINLVAAMVSILSLETAMLARFGEDDDPLFRKRMTGATGGGVCTIVIGLAIFMIWKSTKQLRELKINNSETERK